MMRRAVTFVVVAALAAGAFASSATPKQPVPPPKKAYVNGDSLAIGTAPFLRRALRRWRLNQSYDVSRHLDAETIGALRARRARLARVVVIGLGTNDDPRQSRRFASGVRQVVTIVGRRRCVVWPNIVRRPHRGVSYDAFNRALASEAARRRNLRLVDWVAMVRRNPGWIGPDGVHPNAAGYRARARAIGREMERCRRSLAR